MTDTPPPGPFKLTPSRITLLLMGALALIYIVGGTLFGGVSSYNDLRNARDASLAAESSQP